MYTVTADDKHVIEDSYESAMATAFIIRDRFESIVVTRDYEDGLSIPMLRIDKGVATYGAAYFGA